MTAIKGLLAAGVAVAAMAVAGAAAAAVVPPPTQSAYYDYNADLASFPGAQVICNFEGSLANACVAGYTFSFSGGAAPGSGLMNGSTPLITAAPPGDNTQYASALGPDGNGTLTSVNPLGIFSFYMGSPDAFNSISFYSGANLISTFTGANFLGPPANGNQALGERIFFDLTGLGINKVVFSSTQNSFEFDRIGIGSVPEPATWAMMILGMGMVGMGLRMRRRQAAAAA